VTSCSVINSQGRTEFLRTTGLSPQAWLTVKRFWGMYFAAANAELVS